MIKLRDYQQQVVDLIYAAWAIVLSVLAVVPTGGGKTVIFSYILSRHVGACAAVVHRKEILGQISCSLARLGVKHRVVAPAKTVAMIRKKHLKLFKKSFIDPTVPCGVVSVQTLTSKTASRNADLQRWAAQVTLAVYDEGHHYVNTGSWAKGVEIFSRAKKLFVTATPLRADGKGLGTDADGYCDAIVEGPATKWLIDNGYLSRFKYKCPASDLDVSNLPITASGEVNAKVLRQRTVESHLVGDVVEKWLADPDTRGRKTVVFASDVETAREIAAKFRANGVPAEELNGGTDDGVRERTLDDFEFGELTVLVNVDLFDEGFDVPAVEVVVLARVTMSLGKYLQMIGRVLRVAEGKDFAVVVDPVRNWERHGPPTAPRAWSLESSRGEGGGGAADLIAQRVCAVCTQPFEAFYDACPHCGEPVPAPAGRSAPEQVDGDLIELDIDAMNALFEAHRAANMPPDEYAASLITRGVPSVGRPRMQRKHTDVLHRRSVLHELVAWWMGVQPDDRGMPEKHRRFFHRFGVDILTAFTLDAAGTDALITKIEAKFKEDMTI